MEQNKIDDVVTEVRKTLSNLPNNCTITEITIVFATIGNKETHDISLSWIEE
mgnify:CR=1 FL=1